MIAAKLALTNVTQIWSRVWVDQSWLDLVHPRAEITPSPAQPLVLTWQASNVRILKES